MADVEPDLADGGGGLLLVRTTMTSHDVTKALANDDALSALVRFSRWYSGVHGYLCIAVCVFGIVSNILNIVVLTDRRIASSPTNFILTALAISDMLPMLTYLPYAVYFHCVAGVQPDPRYGYPRAGIIFLLFNNSFIITSHTVSVWLTVTLAVFRYVAVCHHAVAKRYCTLRHARITAFCSAASGSCNSSSNSSSSSCCCCITACCIVVAAVVVCLPTYIMYKPRQLANHPAATVSSGNINGSFGFAVGYGVEIPRNLTVLLYSGKRQQNGTATDGSGYWFTEKDFVGPTFQSVNFWLYGISAGFLARENETETRRCCRDWETVIERSNNFWVYGVALKTAPCILLSVLSALLIRAMRAAELRHRRLVQR